MRQTHNVKNDILMQLSDTRIAKKKHAWLLIKVFYIFDSFPNINGGADL